jgi:hypothetical protein
VQRQHAVEQRQGGLRGQARGASAAASTVVSGTAAIRPTEPQRVRTTSTATASAVATVPKLSPLVTNSTSSGSDAPT